MKVKVTHYVVCKERICFNSFKTLEALPTHLSGSHLVLMRPEVVLTSVLSPNADTSAVSHGIYAFWKLRPPLFLLNAQHKPL